MPQELAVLLSGGVDSSTLLAWLVHSGVRCHPIVVDYGQAAAKVETATARLIAATYDTDLLVVDASKVGKLACNFLTAPDISAEPLFPHRNLLLITLAGIACYENGYLGVAIGVHHTPRYPDCNEAFIEAAEVALTRSLELETVVMAPFVNFSKAQIVSVGKRLGVPLPKTYSCLRGGERHCGHCEACNERRLALGSGQT